MKIAHVSGDDWCGVYVNDVLLYEGHSIPRTVWLELLEELGVEVYELEVDYNWLEMYGRLPLRYEDVKVV